MRLYFFSCETQNRQKVNVADDNKSNISENTASSRSKVEIYCWGFRSDTFFTVQECGPDGGEGIKPNELIYSKILYRTIENRDTIELLKNMIFSNKKDLGEAKFVCHAQFLILFKHDDLGADTVGYAGLDKLCFNDRFLFNYTFNIMDSIKYIIGEPVIKCDCNVPVKGRH